MKELQKIQTELKAPKNLFNKFGGYAYRSCEGILEAVKPLLSKHDCTLTISDEMVFLGERYYIKATATLTNDKGEAMSVTGWAREEEVKKGMDGSQITGASSSYARKYALNGLFAIDDNKDSDDTNTHDKEQPTTATAKTPRTRKAAAMADATPAVTAAEEMEEITHAVNLCTTRDELRVLINGHKEWGNNPTIKDYVNNYYSTLKQ